MLFLNTLRNGLVLALSIGAISICQSADAQQTVLLTPEQESQILRVNEATNAAIFEEYERLQNLQKQLNELMLSSDALEEEIREVYLQLQSSLLRISELNFEKNLQIRGILPSDLREPFARALQEGVTQSASELGNQ